MIIFHHPDFLTRFRNTHPEKWENAGFVPTMGALHRGHISLVETAKQHGCFTIASIFVNPTQFNDPEDFKKYPVTTAEDIRLLEAAGCDMLFLPDVATMYPEGLQQQAPYELGTLEYFLEGKYRPGHFQGVCRVVHTLLEMVRPVHLFMGQKDFQQCMVIRHLIQSKSLPVVLHTCPTLREADGLAMSSRNRRLSPEERTQATAMYRALLFIKAQIATVAPEALTLAATQILLDGGFREVDYVSIANPHTLEPLLSWTPGTPAVALAAAYMGPVRLIDNMELNGNS